MSRVVAYRLVHTTTDYPSLEHAVMQLIREGYEPSGAPFVDNGAVCQSMIKREETRTEVSPPAFGPTAVIGPNGNDYKRGPEVGAIHAFADSLKARLISLPPELQDVDMSLVGPVVDANGARLEVGRVVKVIDGPDRGALGVIDSIEVIFSKVKLSGVQRCMPSTYVEIFQGPSLA